MNGVSMDAENLIEIYGMIQIKCLMGNSGGEFPKGEQENV